MALEEQRKSPSRSANIYSLPQAIEHQHLLIEE